MLRSSRLLSWSFWATLLSCAAATPVIELGACCSFSDSGFRRVVHYAAKVALQEGFFDGVVKNRSFDVNMRLVDTACSATEAGRVALPLLLGQGSTVGRIYSDTEDTPPVVAVAGCYCSGASIVVSQMSSPLEVVVVSGSSTNPDLSSKHNHPYFARVIPSDSAQGSGLAALVHALAAQAPSNSWTEVVLMYPQESYSEGIADAFASVSSLANITIIKTPITYLGTQTEALAIALNYDKLLAIAERVKYQNPMARIFVFPTNGELVPGPIIRAFQECGLFSNKSVVLTSESMLMSFYSEIDRLIEQQPSYYAASVGTISESFWSPSYDWSSLDAAILGWLGLKPNSAGDRLASDDWFKFWTGLTAEKLAAAGLGADILVDEAWFDDLSKFQESDWNPFFFDSVTALFVGIGDLLNAGASESELKGKSLLQAVLNSEFEGLTGNIQYDENGDRLGSYRILNFQANRTLVDIGMFDAPNDEVTLTTAPIFPSGSTDVPWGRPMPCAPGYEYEDDKCRPCPRGQFAAASDSTCVDCPAGSFTSAEGASICSSAPLGMHVPESGSSKATDCEAGLYSDELGAVTCEECSPGFYSPDAGATECSYCELGTYTAEYASSSCNSCATGLTTEHVAAKHVDECVCEEGSYALSSTLNDPNLDTLCVSCPEGLDCEIGSSDNASSLIHPLPLAGYMTRASDMLEAYKCLSESQCPGGGIAACGELRDASSIACGLCVHSAFHSGALCVSCDGGGTDTLVFLGMGALAIVAIVCITLIASRGSMAQTDTSVMVGVSAGLLITSLQTLGVYDQLSFSWFEPVDTFLITVRLLSFNLSALRAECMWGSGAVLGYIARQLVAPLSFPIIVLTISVKHRFRGARSKIGPSVVNATGAICNIFFISIMVSCTGPLICYSHPGGSSSMRSSPSTLCFETSDHAIMLVTAGVVFLLVPLPFMAAAAYGSFYYKTLLQSATSSIQLHAWQFLFGKFTTERYYYLPFLLLRNLLICLVPALFTDAAKQVLLLGLVLMVFALLQMWWKPWRGTWVNLMDGGLTLSLQLMMMAGSMSAGLNVAPGTVSIMGSFVFALFIIVGVAFPMFFLGKLLICRQKLFHCFICHHKEDAAAQARLVKMLLQGSHNRRVFIDSDDLRDLGQLFNIVKVDVGQLVVYLTKDTLRRPWCAGEITTAIISSTANVIAVVTPSFAHDGSFHAQDLSVYIDQSGSLLQQYDIFWEDVERAYNELLHSSDLPRIAITSPLADRGDYNSVVAAILRGHTASVSGNRDARPRVPPREGAAVVMADEDSAEDVAAAGVIAIKLRTFLRSMKSMEVICLVECEVDPFDERTSRCLRTSKACLLLLSAGTLSSQKQVNLLLKAVYLRTDSVIPCTLPGFTFPTQAYYDNVLPAMADMDRIAIGHCPELLMKSLFRLIAIDIQTHASDQLLDVQVTEMLSRLARPSLKMITRSPLVGPVGLQSGSFSLGQHSQGTSTLTSTTPKQASGESSSRRSEGEMGRRQSQGQTPPKRRMRSASLISFRESSSFAPQSNGNENEEGVEDEPSPESDLEGFVLEAPVIPGVYICDSKSETAVDSIHSISAATVFEEGAVRSVDFETGESSNRISSFV